MRSSTLTLLLAVLALALYAQRGHGQSTSQQTAQCPALKVSCPESAGAGQHVVFSVEHAPSDVTKYEWVVSAGTITSGQGTSTISVDTTGLWNQHVTATVETKGLPASCPNSASCAVSVAAHIHYHDKIDQYGNIRFEDEKARLDNLAINLLDLPESKGYVVAYAGRRARVGEALWRAERAKRYMMTVRGVPGERIETIDGGHREHLTVELIVRPKDADAPTPTPSVDPSEVTIIKSRPKPRPRRRVK